MINLIKESRIFISNNLDKILVVTYIFLFIAFFVYSFNIKFPKNDTGETKRVIVMETMTSELRNDPLFKKIQMNKKLNKMGKDAFCTGNDVEGKCEELGKNGKKGCVSVDCCVWVKNKNGMKCVEGDENGPILKKDEKLVDYDTYYYLNKKGKKVF